MTATVDVLLPAYNAEKYLEDAVFSTLDDPTDIRVLILEDGSTDGTLDIAKRLAASNRRIEVFPNYNNQGLIKTLNQGLELCTAPFVARMDADDVCIRNRISIQLRALKNTNAIACATSMKYFGDKSGYWRCPPTKAFLSSLLFRPPFGHSTVIWNREWMVSHQMSYDEAQLHCEDYDLWARMHDSGASFVMVDAPLVKYRRHDQSICRLHSQSQISVAWGISQRMFTSMGVDVFDLPIFDQSKSLIEIIELLVELHRRCKHLLIGAWGESEFARFAASILITRPDIKSNLKLISLLLLKFPIGTLHLAYRRKYLSDTF